MPSSNWPRWRDVPPATSWSIIRLQLTVPRGCRSNNQTTRDGRTLLRSSPFWGRFRSWSDERAKVRLKNVPCLLQTPARPICLNFVVSQASIWNTITGKRLLEHSELKHHVLPQSKWDDPHNAMIISITCPQGWMILTPLLLSQACRGRLRVRRADQVFPPEN